MLRFQPAFNCPGHIFIPNYNLCRCVYLICTLVTGTFDLYSLPETLRDIIASFSLSISHNSWAPYVCSSLSAKFCKQNQTCHCLNRNRFIGQNIILKYFSQAGRPLNKTNSCIYSHATNIRSLFSRTS